VSPIDSRHALRGPHYRQPLPEVTLEIARGSAQRRVRRVRPPVFLIGSASDCDLVLAQGLFPAVHTYLYVTAAGVSVRHLGEGPELAVNGLAVETARLTDGDRLSLGGVEFVVHVQGRPTGTDGLGRGEELHLGEENPAEYDLEWSHAQMLLCDLPAPLRPLAFPARQPSPVRFRIYDDRAIA